MGLFSNLGKGNDAAFAALRENLKKGKTADQCKCIDFLVRPNDLTAKKGCKGCMSKLSGEMTMDKYLEHIQNIVDGLNLKERAIEKIGLDESQISEIPPVLVSWFDFKGKNCYVQSEESKQVKGTYRHVCNLYNVTWIFFSATQIYTYSYYFDTISDNCTESTRDFFYSDITCIRTEHEVEEFIVSKGCGCFKKSKKSYIHANKEWDSLQITVPGDSYSFTCRTNDTIEQSIQAAKAMIREKKGL